MRKTRLSALKDSGHGKWSTPGPSDFCNSAEADCAKCWVTVYLTLHDSQMYRIHWNYLSILFTLSDCVYITFLMDFIQTLAFET